MENNSGMRPAQDASCQDLIMAAIASLELAKEACCDCTPTGCSCSGSITSCLKDSAIQFLNLEPFIGSGTINAGVCGGCTAPFNSDVVFSFLTTNNFPFVYYSNTNAENLPQITCNLSLPSITMTGVGTFVIGGLLVTGTKYTFTFGHIDAQRCSFSLEVRNQKDQFLFSAERQISCEDITINPC